MKKKLVVRYLLLFLPFIIGSICFSLGIYNLFSSILFFVGGYIGLKDVLDYRKINKYKNNISKIEIVDDDIKKEDRSYDSVVSIKRTRRYNKVRKRIKY